MKDKTILIVDDDRYLRDMYSLKFKEHGFHVEESGSVAEALEKLKGGFVPSAIVFDVVMPGQDGYAFLDALSAAGLAHDAVKIALSNQGQDKDVEKAKEKGASAYIVKANSVPSEVVSKVLEHLK